MISGHDFYAVMTAMVPLYVAMFLAYGSVQWWKIFTPDQCSGINRFVAIFAVPLLSFHFISMNNPYTMNLRFLVGDTLQKLIMLILLTLWVKFTKTGTLEWMITIFSLSTLPNTLVIGIPLLNAMYGTFSGELMVQVVVLQCIVWYTLLLFFFEFRGAKMLIMEQFPANGGSIVSVKVDSDVVSFDGQDFLETEAEVGEDGKLHVTVRKSNASRRSVGVGSLSGVEIYSLSSSTVQTPRGSNFNQSDFYSIMGFPGGRLSNFGPAVDSRGPTPRASSFEENMTPFFPAGNPEIGPAVTKGQQPSQNKGNHDVNVFGRSSSAPAVSKGDRVPADHRSAAGQKEIRVVVSDHPKNGKIRETEELERIKVGSNSTAELGPNGEPVPEGVAGKELPSANVMTRLILIMVWRKLVRNPNTYASLLGLIWSLVSFRWHVEMPKIIAKSISLLSDAGLGMAMFSLGLFMALQPKIIACGKSKATLAMVVKFLIGPVVMAVAAVIVGLRGTLLRVAIVQASLSEGVVPFVFAKEYNVHPTILSTSVIFGMLITVPITLVYYIILQL